MSLLPLAKGMHVYIQTEFNCHRLPMASPNSFLSCDHSSTQFTVSLFPVDLCLCGLKHDGFAVCVVTVYNMCVSAQLIWAYCTYVHMHIQVHVQCHICTYVPNYILYVCMYVCAYIIISICTCTYIHVYNGASLIVEY